ncbi:UDP-N-acetylglucosamine 2-epimerase [Oryzomicrobium sp.]|uniref:UDP-N-acetylglucosamine 2-epimerase n=1 Tax=Oryzomicrobium sp. TaxID=1911578 RepID=UPI002FE29F7A
MQTPPRKVCVVTGSRADYGLLYFLMRALQRNPNYELQVAVTGMHLSPEFGMTANVIESDGFPISLRVETLLSSDTAVGVAKATGLGVLGFADALNQLKPDLLVVLGDRFEIFAAAQAALFLRIPIAHIGGGDVTAGAFDEAMRHSISKLAQLHFVTNAVAAERLARMGENPERIFDVGSPGLDHLLHSEFPDRATLEAELDFRFRARNFLVTFHPVTLDSVPSQVQLEALLAALDRYGDDAGVLITLPNADTEGRGLIERLRQYGESRPTVKVFTSLGQRRYLGALGQVDVVIGNSSSGLYEAPSLRTPTVNIGRRQEGRLRAASVFDCAPEADQIHRAITRALAFGRQVVANPYQRGDCARLMMECLDQVQDFPALILKYFHDGTTRC